MIDIEKLMTAATNDATAAKFIRDMTRPPQAPHPLFQRAAETADVMLGQYDPRAMATPPQGDMMAQLEQGAGGAAPPVPGAQGPDDTADFLALLSGGAPLQGLF